MFRRLSPLRLLIAGGDGSIGWVLREIDSLQLKVICQVLSRNPSAYAEFRPITGTADMQNLQNLNENVDINIHKGEMGYRQRCPTWPRDNRKWSHQQLCKTFVKFWYHITSNVQILAKVGAPGLVNFNTAIAYHVCLSLPSAFTQPGALSLADLCTDAYSENEHIAMS